jgi:hypothetical protein
MTATLSGLESAATHSITWVIRDTSAAYTNCEVWWCDGPCWLHSGPHGVEHDREVAYAYQERLDERTAPFEIHVTQWRPHNPDDAFAAPYDARLRPRVVISYDFDEASDEFTGSLTLDQWETAALTKGLRLVSRVGEATGANRLADALDAALDTIRRIEADEVASARERENDGVLVSAGRKTGVPPENLGVPLPNGQRVRALAGTVGGGT